MSKAFDINMRALGDAKSSTGIFKLPGGYMDPDKVLHDEVQIREMTGAEEDILSGRGTIIQKLNALMANCIVRIGTITDKSRMPSIILELPAVDRICLLMFIRMVTISDDYSFDAPCPKCQESSTYTVLLSSLKIQEMPDKTKREFEVVMPSGKKAVVKILLGKDEVAAGDIATKFPDDLNSAVLACRTVSIDDRPSSIKEIKALGWNDVRFLRAELSRNDASLDTKIDNSCSKCGNEFSVELDIGSSNFFYPSQGGVST